MNLEELRATLIGWLSFLKPWTVTSQDWEDYILTDEEFKEYSYPSGLPENVGWGPNPDRLVVIFFTNNHEYRISCNAKSNYMSGYVENRKPRPGENWTRGNDLPDGSFCKETFDSIIRRAFAYEIIAKVKRVEPTADNVAITSSLNL